MKKKQVIVACLLVILCAGLGIVVYFYFSSKDDIGIASTPGSTNTGSKAKVGCTSDVRLENEPQYDRALSLIKQRIDNQFDFTDEKLKFAYFPSQLTNCIKIVEKNMEGAGIEGSFTFHSEDIQDNYFPITVDVGYSDTDDVLTALLLSHEMTHVQQYINEVNNTEELLCVDKEVEAFIAQLGFYTLLNNEEISAAYYRIQNDDHLHPQLQVLDAMMTINRESSCGFEGVDFGRECKRKNLYSHLKTIISEDAFYKQECGL